MFTFKHFFLLNFHCLTYSALVRRWNGNDPSFRSINRTSTKSNIFSTNELKQERAYYPNRAVQGADFHWYYGKRRKDGKKGSCFEFVHLYSLAATWLPSSGHLVHLPVIHHTSVTNK